jgi:hypothetical protein
MAARIAAAKTVFLDFARAIPLWQRSAALQPNGTASGAGGMVTISQV